MFHFWFRASIVSLVLVLAGQFSIAAAADEPDDRRMMILEVADALTRQGDNRLLHENIAEEWAKAGYFERAASLREFSTRQFYLMPIGDVQYGFNSINGRIYDLLEAGDAKTAAEIMRYSLDNIPGSWDSDEQIRQIKEFMGGVTHKNWQDKQLQKTVIEKTAEYFLRENDFDNWSAGRAADFAYDAAVHGHSEISQRVASQVLGIIANTSFKEAALVKGASQARANAEWEIDKVGIVAAQGDYARAQAMAGAMGALNATRAKVRIHLTKARKAPAAERMGHAINATREMFQPVRDAQIVGRQRDLNDDPFAWQGFGDIVTSTEKSARDIVWYLKEFGSLEEFDLFIQQYIAEFDYQGWHKWALFHLDYIARAYHEEGEEEKLLETLDRAHKIASFNSTQFERELIDKVYETYWDLGFGDLVHSKIAADHKAKDHVRRLFLSEALENIGKTAENNPDAVNRNALKFFADEVLRSSLRNHRDHFYRNRNIAKTYLQLGDKDLAHKHLKLAMAAWRAGNESDDEMDELSYFDDNELYSFFSVIMLMAEANEQEAAVFFNEYKNGPMFKFFNREYFEEAQTAFENGVRYDRMTAFENGTAANRIVGTYAVLDSFLNHAPTYENLAPNLSRDARVSTLEKLGRLHRAKGQLQQSRAAYARIFESFDRDANVVFDDFLIKDPVGAWAATMTITDNEQFLYKLVYDWLDHADRLPPSALAQLQARVQ